MKTKFCFGLLVLWLLTGLAPTVRAIVAFTVTPSVISNTYAGTLTFQVTGLTNTETVVVQKFLDANTNGTVDAGDLLWQQFTLTDGTNMVFHNGGTAVTNFNVPGDTDGTANGTITAKLYPSVDFAQVIVGQYFYVLSSPAGHFTPLTNSFIVTNFPYAQSFTGNVVSNATSTTVPNAVILLLNPNSNGNPVGGTVANNSGAYTIKMPPGTYQLLAFKSNFVVNASTAPTVSLTASATITTNLVLTNATQTISGKMVDLNNSSLGLSGILLPVQTQGGNGGGLQGLLGIAFTDTNGNFTARVIPNQWQVAGDETALAVKGYLSLQNKMTVDTTTGSVSGVTIALPKATAAFYGTVKDNLGNPLAGVIAIYTSDNNGQYETDGYTDTNGNYVAIALGSGSGDPWQVNEDYGGPANYIYSQGTQVTLNAGQAYHYNFTGILATNFITGNVQFNGSPVSGVGVNANATINSVGYQPNTAHTDSNGNYSINVANGSWSVNVNCNGGNDSLDNILGNGTYQCPDNQNSTINNNNGTANFVVQAAGGGQVYGYVTDPGNNPVVGVTVYASDGGSGNYSTSTDGSGYYSFNVANGNWDISVDCGGLNSLGYQCVSDQNVGVSSDSIEADFNVQFSALQISTTSLPNGTNSTFYSQSFQASGGTPPYSWSIPNYSADPPANLNLATSGILSGTPSTTVSTYYFDVVVSDAAANSSTQTFSLTIVNPPLLPLVITNVSLPNGNVGAAYSAQLGANGGQLPYSWSLALGSANPPLGLTLYSSGLISGTPTTNKVSTFKVQVNDSNADVTNKILSITINPRPILSAASWLTNQFQMLLTGASNQNYTVQVSTNLNSTNWASLFITNNTITNAFQLKDPNATNKQGFYRVIIGP